MRRSTSRSGAGFRRIFGAPVLLGIVSLVGLLSALFADGLWDVLSWFALGAPLAVILCHWAWTRPR